MLQADVCSLREQGMSLPGPCNLEQPGYLLRSFVVLVQEK